MEDNFKDFFGETKILVKDYAEKRLQLVKLQASLKTSQALGLFFSLLITFFILFFVIVFGGMWLSFWLADKTGSTSTGFAVSTGILIILLVILLVFRKKIIQIPVANMVARELTDDDEEDGF